MDLARRRSLALRLFEMEEWQVVVEAVDRMEINAVETLRVNPRDERPSYELFTLANFKSIITQLAENAGYNDDPFRTKSRYDAAAIR